MIDVSVNRLALRIALAITLTTLRGAPAAAQTRETADLTVHADQPGPIFNREIFGQFAEHLGTGIYGGLWVGSNSKIPNTRGFRNDVVGALRALQVPVIRWPGGCFADEYHWREGIGPRNKRPVKINTHWGGVTEPNTVGTHEFMDLAEQIGADVYISGNVGSGTPQEMAEWVEYMTSPAGTLAEERAKNGHKAPWKVPFFGIGNELWGCGGNMRPEYAADLTRRYATFIKAPADTKILRIASGANTDDYNWTAVMARETAKQVDGVSLHYYTIPGHWPPRASATQFDEAGWAETLSETGRMDELITRHAAEMDKVDPQKKTWLAVDEWGTWYSGEPGTNPGFLQQQNTLRDALVAAININIFARHADRVRMAAIAQMVNVLQAMILTKDDKMVLTPTYYVFAMYQPWMGATVLPIELKSPWYGKDKWTMAAVSASAVRDTNGKIHVGLANLDPNKEVTVTATIAGAAATGVGGQVLTSPAMNALNSVEQPAAVKPVAFDGARLANGMLTVKLPPKSVVMLDLR
ncbi:alpha-N-arabinofuranosidase (plasmid) [Polymorphobacter sp. PAMC 29334]|uniref:alpha-N-arabinofuranosidase n=1 Tax=Polymorphobacter sp. PAMC 29334 TaxID=2862331 RepID=UPI001C77A050|nr:alpha-L-arabinofuranosidase C-terminal domain-containing protein [Polymorphobacter sp. PAMC 29334]QYE32997.1 alpha-N-arabinofuranosidase [Polymorphobacter sp. PAMC 29334]